MLLGLGGIGFGRAQVDVGPNRETIRVNRHMLGLMAICVKQGRIVAQGAAGSDGRARPAIFSIPTRATPSLPPCSNLSEGRIGKP